MNGFALGSQSGIEEKAITLYASMHHIPCKRVSVKEVPEGFIPVGTVEWFMKVTGWKFKPDNYPEFLRPWLKRKIWETDEWPLGQKVFIKPSDAYKRFNGRITNGTYRDKKKGPYWCSEIVKFTNEWRYYVSHGKVVHVGWYDGVKASWYNPTTPVEELEEDLPAPELDIDWPSDWVGSADFGTTSDRGVCLVESHEPFSVGCYMSLSNYEIYGKWVVDGWEYLNKRYGTK
jgi:hypothetical protein